MHQHIASQLPVAALPCISDGNIRIDAVTLQRACHSHAGWLEDVFLHVFFVRNAGNALDDSTQNNVAAVAVLVARSGREQRFQAGHKFVVVGIGPETVLRRP